MSTTKELVAWLSDPASHPDNPEHVEVHETHISWVFVTRQFAYKLKKPVHFEFLDFRSFQQRRQACLDEVRLNRRLAPDAYLGAVAVTCEADGTISLGGTGESIDWVVKMQRLDAARRCDHLLRDKAVDNEQLSSLAHTLAHFYRHAPVIAISPAHYVARLVDHVSANRRDLLENLPESMHSIVKRVHADQLTLLRVCAGYFHDRICGGHVVDGHGDLRPEHVYFYSTPKIVDCIEFSDEYRAVDVCDDLCFFAMECAALGAPKAGTQVREECLTELGDTPRDELRNFYTSYRACVRAKVVLCGPAQPAVEKIGGAERALEYLRLAESHAALAGPPWLVVVYGGVGTGKSTLARRLAEMLGCEYISTDTVRREVFGGGGRGAEVNQGIYSPANRLLVYNELFQRAARWLDEGVPVVLDGSFQLGEAWQDLERVLPHTQARPLAVHCRCGPEVARRRIEKRLACASSQSDARPEMVQEDAGGPAPPENLPRVGVDTSHPPGILAECVFRRMRAILGKT